MNRRLLILAALAVFALPAAAEAASKTSFGSSLSATPNRIEQFPVDSAFWHANLPGTRAFKVPAKGKVGTIKLKGNIQKRNGVKPVDIVHFQILHPIGNGRVRVMLTSGNNRVPVGGDKNRVTTYHPINLCARKGDYVALSTIGGYKPPAYPKGTPFRVFSSVQGSATKYFSKAGGDNNGDEFKGSTRGGEELLMRMTLWSGTGPGGAGICNSYNPSRAAHAAR